MKAVLQRKPDARILFLAFNVLMMQEIKAKLRAIEHGSDVRVCTIHALGLHLLLDRDPVIEVVPDKMYRLAKSLAFETRES